MGHRSAKDIYETLSERLDGASVRLPRTQALDALLRELYRPDEAAFVSSLPMRLSRIDRVADISGQDISTVRAKLDQLADKGLVLDLVEESTGERYYMPSPFIIGIFEFTMMRAGPKADHAHRAQLFHRYLETGEFYRANLGNGQQVLVARALAHNNTLDESIEIIDSERVSAIVAEAKSFAVGICSCRHEREHATGKPCGTPLETCTAMGTSADYLVRHGLARSISRSEMLDIVARSREMGLLLCADNVKHSVGFLCHCCTCCCHLIRGVTQFGHPNAITTAPFAPSCRSERCDACGACVRACPVSALSTATQTHESRMRPTPPNLDSDRCIGCGICVTRCRRDALRLVPGARRRILPENSLERVILQSLERGTLQNLVFDNPRSRAQVPMRALLGGLLRLPPIQRALVGDAFRSTFLRGLAAVSGYDGP